MSVFGNETLSDYEKGFKTSIEGSIFISHNNTEEWLRGYNDALDIQMFGRVIDSYKDKK